MDVLTENYFDTLSAALDAVEARLADARCVVEDPDYLRQRAFPQGVPQGHGIIERLGLREYQGRPTHKGATVCLYRMHSGKYELTFYVL
jgi:hypothetical protein